MDTRAINVLSICSGYGGTELGIEAALAGRTRTVCYVENEIGVASILAARMEDSLDPAPIWTDIRTFDPEPWRGKVDILAGGFPCQPHSVAGNKLGEDDPRELSGEVLRIAAGLGYPTLFLENVPGILRFYWDSIRPKLREMGYSVAEGLFTASETGAPHKRERLFIMAHADEYGVQEPRPTHQPKGRHASATPVSDGEELAHADCYGQATDTRNYGKECSVSEKERQPKHSSTVLGRSGSELAHAGVEGLEGIRPTRKAEYQERPETLPLYPPGPSDNEGWAYMLNVMPEAQPTFCRVNDGATAGVERRLRALGNGVVPAVSAVAFRTLSKDLK